MIQAGMDLKVRTAGRCAPNAGQKGGETGDFPGAKGDAAAEGAARHGVEITAQLVPEDSKYDYDGIVKAYGSDK